MVVRLLIAAWLALLVAGGLLWQECLLLAGAVLAAQRLVLWQGRRDLAREPWRVGLRCLLAGSFGLVGAVGLGVAFGVALAAGWWPAHLAPGPTVLLMAGTAALLCGVQAQARQCVAEAALWLPWLLAAAAALSAPPDQRAQWACAVSGVGLLILLGTSWRLARGGAAWLGDSVDAPG